MANRLILRTPKPYKLQLGVKVAAVNVVWSEEVTGAVDGVNPIFTLAHTPNPQFVQLSVNGLIQHSGAGNDYSLSGATITFTAQSTPQPGDVVLASYSY